MESVPVCLCTPRPAGAPSHSAACEPAAGRHDDGTGARTVGRVEHVWQLEERQSRCHDVECGRTADDHAARPNLRVELATEASRGPYSNLESPYSRESRGSRMISAANCGTSSRCSVRSPCRLDHCRSSGPPAAPASLVHAILSDSRCLDPRCLPSLAVDDHRDAGTKGECHGEMKLGEHRNISR
eukprot:scaffold254416_cov28-Tisochrysis_lutea.AAC.2